MICFFAVFGVALAEIFKGDSYQDVFSHEDILVPSDQVLGRLLVADGNAVVYGSIREGIIVVDGNLMVKAGASVKGRVLVIGGTLEVEPGAVMQERGYALAPTGFSLSKFFVVSFLLLGTVGIGLVPFLLFLLLRLLKRTTVFPLLQKKVRLMQQRWPALYIIASLAISALMLVLFMETAWETMFQSTMNVFDNGVIWLIRYYANAKLDKVMIFITNLGYSSLYMIIVAATFLILFYCRRWLEGLALGICLLGAGILNFILKNLFERARPELFRVVDASGYSFPSGHAMVSLCFYGLLAFLAARNIKSAKGRLLIITFAVGLIVLIGISRIYLGVHYPTDVVAGYAAGSMWLAFCISLLMWWEKTRETK